MFGRIKETLTIFCLSGSGVFLMINGCFPDLYMSRSDEIQTYAYEISSEAADRIPRKSMQFVL